MKLTVMAVLCLSLLLAHFSLAKKGGGLGSKINFFKKTPKITPKQSKPPKQSNQGSYPKQPDRPGSYPNQGSYPQQPGSYPNTNQGGYPQQPGSYPQHPGSYPNPNQGGYPQQPGSYPNLNQGGHPQHPGSYPNPNQGGYPQQPGGYPNQGGYPQQPGGYPNQGSYPQQPGGYPNPNQRGYPQQPGGYPNQGGYPQHPGGYPNQGGHPHHPGNYPNQGGYPQQPGGYPGGGYPAQGYPYGGGYGGYGGYPGGYINYNPNNKILSPRYGGGFGYGGYGVGGGSPFSQSVQTMGVYPQEKSRQFGRSAMMAAAGGAMAGMALGYGLGRFPRPNFHFHSPQEEYYYNHYMYKKYGIKSTDTNDYGRDYSYSQPPQNYDNYMDNCVKRTDLLPAENQQPNNKPAATTKATTTAVPSAPDTGTNATESNSTAAGNSSTSAPSTPQLQNQTEANPVPPASQALGKTATDDDDDTVSIVEIGYPALIKQLKVRRCLALYMVYSEKYLKKNTEPSAQGGVSGLEMSLQGLLTVATSTILMLLNSNMLMMLR